MKSTGAKALERRMPGTSLMVETMRFFIWMDGLHAIPRPERIQARFGVSRATAYRWLRAWRDALALPDPHTERQSTREAQ